MKRTMKSVLMTLAMLATPLTASAQLGDIQGYVNAFIRVQVVSSQTGPKVCVKTKKSDFTYWKETFDVQKALPVYLNSVQLICEANNVSNFFGWYIDDGDGVFDLEKDENYTEEKLSTIFISTSALSDSEEYYETEVEAQNASDKPTSPQVIIWAFFSNAATAYPDYVPLDLRVFGNVSIDKKINEPGDVVTVTAEPFEGYQFEYWKTIKGSTLGLEDKGVVSYDNPYSFTVQGGEKLYAYFTQTDAPIVHFPETGGWKALAFDKVWWLHEQSEGIIYCPIAEELYKNDDGIYFNLEGAEMENTQKFNPSFLGRNYDATLMFGKGDVRFAYSTLNGQMAPGYAISWSGDKGYTVTDTDERYYYVYKFVDNMEGFFEIGNTDLNADINAPTSVFVPANCAYIKLSPFDMVDMGLLEDGVMPSIIALTPKAFEPFQEDPTFIEKAKVSERNLGGMKVYTLSGVKVRATDQPGIYIVDGKKVAIKN